MGLAAGSIWGLSPSLLVWDRSTKTPAVHSCLDKGRQDLEGKIQPEEAYEVQGGYMVDGVGVWDAWL